MNGIALRIRRFFEFSQNNSGGSFVENEKRGIGTCVIVEAEDWKAANERAQDIGLYWNGCDTGQDCSCCGDRWYPQWNEEGDPVPSSYGKPVWGYAAGSYRKGAYIHYLDGSIEHVVFARGSRPDNFFSDEYFEDRIPEAWRVFSGAGAGQGDRSTREEVLLKIRKLLAPARDQADKPEGRTARRVAEHIAKEHGISLILEGLA